MAPTAGKQRRVANWRRGSERSSAAAGPRPLLASILALLSSSSRLKDRLCGSLRTTAAALAWGAVMLDLALEFPAVPHTLTLPMLFTPPGISEDFAVSVPTLLAIVTVNFILKTALACVLCGTLCSGSTSTSSRDRLRAAAENALLPTPVTWALPWESSSPFVTAREAIRQLPSPPCAEALWLQRDACPLRRCLRFC